MGKGIVVHISVDSDTQNVIEAGILFSKGKKTENFKLPRILEIIDPVSLLLSLFSKTFHNSIYVFYEHSAFQ